MDDLIQNELADADGGPKIDLKEVVLFGIARSWLWVGLCVLGGGVGSVLMTSMQPDIYSSKAKLLLRVGTREQITPEVLVQGGDPPRDSRPTLRDEVHLLSDIAIYEGVARKVGPAQVLWNPDPRRGDGPNTPVHRRWLHRLQAALRRPSGELPPAEAPIDERLVPQAAKLLAARTLLLSERNSNVITVSHNANSAHRAQAMNEAIVAAFIERHREVFSVEPYLDRSKDKLSEAQNLREEADGAYFEHIELCNFIDLGSQGPALLAEIEGIESQLFDARTKREELDSERGDLQRRLGDTPPLKDVVTPAVMRANPEYDAQLAVKTRLLTERQNLAFEHLPLEEKARRQKEYDKQLGEIDGLLEELPKQVVEEAESIKQVPNIEFTTLKSRIDDLNVSDHALGTRVDALAGRLKERRERMDQLRECENTHGILQSVRTGAKAKYQQLQERYWTLVALNSINVDDEANLRVLQSPTFNSERVGSSRKKSMLLGLVGGTFLGIGFAVARQLLDRRLRYPETIERELGIHVLGVVPEVSSLRKLALRRRAA